MGPPLTGSILIRGLLERAVSRESHDPRRTGDLFHGLRLKIQPECSSPVFLTILSTTCRCKDRRTMSGVRGSLIVGAVSRRTKAVRRPPLSSMVSSNTAKAA